MVQCILFKFKIYQVVDAFFIEIYQCVAKIKPPSSGDHIVVNLPDHVKLFFYGNKIRVFSFPVAVGPVGLFPENGPDTLFRMLGSIEPVPVYSVFPDIIGEPLDDVVFWCPWVPGLFKKGVELFQLLFQPSLAFPFLQKMIGQGNILLAFCFYVGKIFDQCAGNGASVIPVFTFRTCSYPVITPEWIDVGYRAGMINNYIHDNPDSMFVRCFNQLCQLLLCSKIGVQRGPVPDPVAMVSVCTSCSLVDHSMDLFMKWGHPDGRDP